MVLSEITSATTRCSASGVNSRQRLHCGQKVYTLERIIKIPRFAEIVLEPHYDDSSQGFQGKENHPSLGCDESPSHTTTTSHARIAPPR